jgi:hypothetical protein
MSAARLETGATEHVAEQAEVVKLDASILRVSELRELRDDIERLMPRAECEWK